jgi:hypothetical protein
LFRSPRTDDLLWAVPAAGIFVAIGFVDVLPGPGDGRLWARARALAAGHYGCATGEMLIDVGLQAAFLAVAAAGVGRVGQAAAVRCGLRVSGRAAGQTDEPGRPSGAGAADYAEWAGGSVGTGPGQLTDGWGPAEPGTAADPRPHPDSAG